MQQKPLYTVFAPYFGKLPHTFNLWLDSCSYNKQFLFIVFTDCDYSNPLPQNVIIKKKSFSNLKNLIQSKFNFPISLEEPYKLCDYKPAFGYIFQEYLDNNCRYWGHCDIDLIFGNLAKFLPSGNFDKIGYLGHLCLYKNTPVICQAFTLTSNSSLTYKDVFSSKVHFAFDEAYSYGINAIFNKHGMTIYPLQENVADTVPTKEDFTLSLYHYPTFTTQKGKRIFSFENGKIYGHTLQNEQTIKQEYAYIHLQKRTMKIDLKGTESRYLIIPNSFIQWRDITPQVIRNSQPHLLIWKQIKHFLTIKQKSFPRFLQREYAIKKIIMKNSQTREITNENINYR